MKKPSEIIKLHKKMDALEKPIVKQIGDAIGYGRLMQLAEQIWREKLAERGLDGGEHTVGACAAFMVPCEHWVKDDRGHCDICCGAGRVTKGVANLFKQKESENA